MSSHRRRHHGKLRIDERHRLMNMYFTTISHVGPTARSLYDHDYNSDDGVRDRLRQRGLIEFLWYEVMITDHGAWNSPVYEITPQGRRVVEHWKRLFEETGRVRFQVAHRSVHG